MMPNHRPNDPDDVHLPLIQSDAKSTGLKVTLIGSKSCLATYANEVRPDSIGNDFDQQNDQYKENLIRSTDENAVLEDNDDAEDIRVHSNCKLEILGLGGQENDQKGFPSLEHFLKFVSTCPVRLKATRAIGFGEEILTEPYDGSYSTNR
jgi:hypothetical protein